MNVYIATQSGYESTPRAFDCLSAALTFVLGKVLSERDKSDSTEIPRVLAMVTAEDFALAGVLKPAEWEKNPIQWFYLGNWHIQSVRVSNATEAARDAALSEM